MQHPEFENVVRDGLKISLSNFQQILIHDYLFPLLDYLEAESIPYSLAFGTMLGAIRDHAIIPWDFDIDLMIPEHALSQKLNDLETYAKALNGVFKSYLRNECSYGLSRLVALNLYVSRPSMKEHSFYQAYIDIYSYREITVTPNLAKDQNVIKKRWLISLIKADLDPAKNPIKNLVKQIIRPLLPSASNKWLSKRLRKPEWNIPGSSVLILHWECVCNRIYPPVKGICPVEFMGRRCLVPTNAEDFLAAEYGDWQTPRNDGRSEDAVFYQLSLPND